MSVHQLGMVEVEMGTKGSLTLIEKPRLLRLDPPVRLSPVFYAPLLCGFRPGFDEPLDGLCIKRDRYGSSRPPGVLNVGYYVRSCR